MEGSHPQTPVVQEIQSEVEEVAQRPSEKPKKRSGVKILIILLIALLGLVLGGYYIWKNYIWKNISVPETKNLETTSVERVKTEEKGYIYKGVMTPVLDYSFSQVSMLPGNPEDYRPQLFDLDWVEENGINILAFNVGLWANERGEVSTLPGVREPLISFIDEAHSRGIKIWLVGELLHQVDGGRPNEMRTMPKEMVENTDLMRNFDLAVIEWAKIAEEHNVEIFSPISEAYVNFGGERGKKWLEEIKPKIDAVYSGKICETSYWVISQLSSYSCFAPSIPVPKNELEKNELINKIETEAKKRDVELMLHLWEGNDWQGSQEDAKKGFEMAFEAGKGRVSGIFFLDFPRPTPVFPESFGSVIKELYIQNF